MKDVTGKCRFCGQERMARVPDVFTEEQIDEVCTRECHCTEAKAYQARLEAEARIEQFELEAQGTIYELFHEEYPNVEEILTALIHPLNEGHFKKLSVKIDDTTSVSMTSTSNGIKVVREDKKKRTRETVI